MTLGLRKIMVVWVLTMRRVTYHPGFLDPFERKGILKVMR